MSPRVASQRGVVARYLIQKHAASRLHYDFWLDGKRLHGRWALIRMGRKAGAGGKNWLLKKLDDDEARSAADYDISTTMTKSVASGRTMKEIANDTEPSGTTRQKAGRA